MNKRQVILELISALLILLFLYASLSKFLDFKQYIGDMHNQPLPNTVASILIWGIPPLEVLISLLLVFEVTRLAGFYTSLVLMSLFTVYTVFILLHFFKYVPCSCGGIIRKLSWGEHLGFNLFFVALSLTGIILQRNKFSKTTFITKNSLV